MGVDGLVAGQLAALRVLRGSFPGVDERERVIDREGLVASGRGGLLGHGVGGAGGVSTSSQPKEDRKFCPNHQPAWRSPNSKGKIPSGELSGLSVPENDATSRTSPLELQPERVRRIGALLRQGCGLSNFPESDDQNRYKTSRWCYQDGETRVACLWWEGMWKESDGGIGTRVRLRYDDEDPKRTEARVEKALELLEMLRVAKQEERPVRVIICLAHEYDVDTEARRTKARRLDLERWWVTDLEWDTGEVELRRGGRLVAGRWESPGSAQQAERSEYEELLYDLADIDADEDTTETEKEALRKARIGQGEFRAKLMERWQGKCAVTGVAIPGVLRASHIVAWREATNKQRRDPNNGLLLSASIDALFDRHMISFGANGAMLIGKDVGDADIQLLTRKRRIDGLNEDEKRYLAHHRSCFESRNKRSPPRQV